jgi:hypothetical protein
LPAGLDGGAAGWAGGGVTAKVVKADTTVVADPLCSPFWFRH